MALEEFTGDLRNGPVELPCHTQRPAMQRVEPEGKRVNFPSGRPVIPESSGDYRSRKVGRLAHGS